MHRAINVLPQPGGPCNKIPFICLQPNFFIISIGTDLEANARLKIRENSRSSPPTPISSKFQFN
ncbi:hypothetical protein LDVICp209 [lymphocystis disease virus-China]|uniref:Uncharacterized protein n=1 Tax=lymphocystis disease virus-China TaxID=256729 RepID=Q677Q5_9VIRU|nr:hypothetical protein LDVICp209 [lymphocystis disease virus-China]AAU11052.1 hypothetical protein [lymphocystis disease virus-China]